MSENPYSPQSDTPAEPIAGEPTNDEKTWAMVCHISALAGYFIPFGHIIGPLVVWLIKKDGNPFVDDQGKEALNFQISVTIYAALAFLLVFILIGFPLLIALGIFVLVMIVVAAIKSNQGQRYRYPLTIRFLK